MFDIIIGRTEEDKALFGTQGTIFIGKQYIKMGNTTSLSNPIYMDVTRSHVVFICGKRGGGKSYTMGVIAEGISDLPIEIKQNIAVLMLDTMGIYWTMKYKNKQDEALVEAWGMKAKELDIIIYTPIGFYNQYKEDGIPTDRPFAIKPAELNPSDWFMSFGIEKNSPEAILVERIIATLKEKGIDYSLDDILSEIRADKKSPQNSKDAAENMFMAAKTWGLFDINGTPLSQIVKGGQVTVLDVSCYTTMSGANELRALVIGLIAQKLFIKRMIAKKFEEFNEVHETMHYIADEDSAGKKEMPVVWLVVDEAHEFLPREGMTVASQPLITILREGRQPGISLILATQQPAKIHTDVMTQADIVIAHRITAKIDTDALGSLMQSYMREGIDTAISTMPTVKGAAIVFDDNNERLFPMKIRPRFTWHGGAAPSAIHKSKEIFKF